MKGGDAFLLLTVAMFLPGQKKNVIVYTEEKSVCVSLSLSREVIFIGKDNQLGY